MSHTTQNDVVISNTSTTPAEQHNQQLIAVNERLRQQNKTLTLEIETCNQESRKLKNENTDLDKQLNMQSRAKLDEAVSIKTMKSYDVELTQVHGRYEELQNKNKSYKDTIDEVTQRNIMLQKQNEEYQVMVEQLQNEEILLKAKVQQQSDELDRLKAKYNVLDEELSTQQTVAMKNLELAQGLEFDLTQLNEAHGAAIESINNKEMIPDSLRTRLRLGITDADIHAEDTDRSGAGTFLSPNYSEYLQWRRTTRRGDTQRVDDDTQRYSDDELMNDLKEEMKREFDWKLQEEQDKHRLEIFGLKAEIHDYHEQLVLEKTKGNDKSMWGCFSSLVK